MKIQIYKKDNEENVYYKLEGNKEQKLNFENIKEISKSFLDMKRKGEPIKYEINIATSDLELYKTTLENVINSILVDDDLLKLYNETQNNEEDEQGMEEESKTN